MAAKPAKAVTAPATSRRFSRDDVISAGVDITAEAGLDALTLQAVAARLGVRRPSLYHHLPGGLAELRTGVVDRISATLKDVMGEEPEGASVLARIEGPMRRVGRTSRQYPGVLQYLLTSGRDERLTLAEADRVVRLFLESELRDVTPEAYVMVHAYVTGWIFAQRPTREAAEAEGFAPLAEVLRRVEAIDSDQLFFEGLRAMLRGLLADQAPADTGTRAPEQEPEKRAPSKRIPRTLRKRRRAG